MTSLVKYSLLCCLLALSACTYATASNSESEALHSQYCTEHGFVKGSYGYDDCIADSQSTMAKRDVLERGLSTPTKQNDVDTDKEYKAYLAQIRKQEAAEAKAKAKVKQQQLSADKATCSNYGIKKGTAAFSNCLIQVEQARQHQAQRRQAQAQLLQERQASQQQQIELQRQQLQAQREAAQAAAWQNLTSTGFQIMQQAQPSYQPVQPMLPTTTNCHRTVQGVSCTTW